MKKIHLLVLIGVIVLFSGCTVLSKSQVKNINAFATTAKSYAYFPSEIVKQRAELVLEERLIASIQLPADQIKRSIDDARKNYLFQQQIADQMDLSLQLIQQYSSLLSKLSSGDFVENLSANTTELNDNLSGLVKIANSRLPNKIPGTVGTAITKAIFLVGARLTKNKQAKALKEFIPVGDTLIKITVKNLVDVLSKDLADLLASDKQKFINTYTNNILAKESKVDYSSLNQYLGGLSNYENLELLRKTCVEAADKLSIAHSRLNSSIQAKTDLPEIFSETQDLIVSVKELFKTFSQLTSHQ
ncbi:MAG: hypothetical protein H7Z13_20165 [Ferruginibacter sp.]|nr:hypothetical protein [Ferruginibacter sp.]